ncbi:hypothetical protein FOA52_012814 [Chlamydomonas sp. UWO 241]|nr:hypothetical protein FOA52_012814 [Chlamydomonas sp. UWO 241]
MNHPDLTSSNIAKTVMFTSASRLRKWKPQSGLPEGPNREFCQLDDSVRLGQQDMVMRGRECSTASLFPGGLAPKGVVSVFPDANLVSTHTIPYEKCVFEIDPSAVTAESANLFWDAMNDMHCEGLGKDLHRGNLPTEASLATVLAELDRARAKYKRLLVDGETRTQTIAATKAAMRLVQAERSRLKDEMDALDTERTALGHSLYDQYAQYDVKIAEMSRRADAYRASIAAMEAQAITDNGQLTLWRRQIAETGTAYDAKVAELDRLHLSVADVYAKRAAVQATLQPCLMGLARTQRDLSDCTEDGARLSAELAQRTKQKTACDASLVTCEDGVGALEAEIAAFKLRTTAAYDDLTRCTNGDLPACGKDRDEEKSRWEFQKGEHTAWKDLPHYSCSGELLRHDASELAWTRLKDEFPNQTVIYQSETDRFTKLAAIDYQNKMNQIQACSQNKYDVKPFTTTSLAMDQPGPPGLRRYDNFMGSYRAYRLDDCGGDEAWRAGEAHGTNGNVPAFRLLADGRLAKSWWTGNNIFRGSSFRPNAGGMYPDLFAGDAGNKYSMRVLISPRFMVSEHGSINFKGKVDDIVIVCRRIRL